MNFILRLAICILVAVNSFYLAFSQSSPAPDYSRVRRDLGFFVGLGQNVQSGDMLVDCKDCKFTGGTKFGYTLGLLFGQEIYEYLQFGVSFSYNYLGINSVFNEIEPLSVDNGNSYSEIVNVNFHHEADVDIHNIMVSPYLKWTPLNFMFVRAGLGLSTNFSTNIVHTKTLSKNTVRLSNGEIGLIDIALENQKVQDSELRNPISFQMYAQPALGFNIPFSKSVTFSPIFEYNIPFSKISDFSEDFKISYFRILFELRIAITKRGFDK